MKIAHFQCSAGVSGDMMLGALVDAGLDFTRLEQEINKLNISGYRLEQHRVVKRGISGTKVDVIINEKHVHRHLRDIEEIIENSDLASPIKEKCCLVFGKIAEAEAKVHNSTKEEIHFHEVGSLDAIIDVVGSVVGLDLLGVEKVTASKIHVGTGYTKCAHGTIPLPAPATLELLQGIPVYCHGIEKELVTPTGAALITTLAESFGEMPSMSIADIGYGAGTRELDIPNLLRISLGESTENVELGVPAGGISKTLEQQVAKSFAIPAGGISKTLKQQVAKSFANGSGVEENGDFPDVRFGGQGDIQQAEAMMLEVNIDDLNPEFYDHLFSRLLAEGAHDVFLQPIQMKKNRPAVKLSILTNVPQMERILEIVFQETSTIGVRTYPVTKYMLPYEIKTMATKYGDVRVKAASLNNTITTIAPEYEDCRSKAESYGEPIKNIYEHVKYEAKKAFKKDE